MRDEEKIEALTRDLWSRAPSRIERVPAGLGSRRFYRVRFERESAPASDRRAAAPPTSLIARIEPDTQSGAEGTVATAAVEGAARRLVGATPPAWRNEPPLEPIRRFLERAGLPVPASYAHAPEFGLDLLEDVGSVTLAAASGDARMRLYREACQLVPRLQRLAPDADGPAAFERALDRALIRTKCWKFLHWTIPGLLDREASDAEVSGLEGLFEAIADLCEAAPRRLSHRDFKAENLHLVLPSQASEAAPRSSDPAVAPAAQELLAEARLVMIDVQGAFLAPPEYDLVCLLRDLQVDLEERFVERHFEHIRTLLPDQPSQREALRRFDALAVARLCKDVSHVVHAGLVRQDRRRWAEIPRGLELIRRSTGRLEHTLPESRALTSVIQALSAATRSADSRFREEST